MSNLRVSLFGIIQLEHNPLAGQDRTETSPMHGLVKQSSERHTSTNLFEINSYSAWRDKITLLLATWLPLVAMTR
jgi:hypothetical protein